MKAERPDTKTVTVRRVEPKPRQKQATGPARVPWIGSLGKHRDLWVLLTAGCYENPVVGHGWVPPAEVHSLIACTDEAWEAGYDRENDEGERRDWVAFAPSCDECRKAARHLLRERGLDDEKIRSLFGVVGAPWRWTTPDKREARRESDAGIAMIDPESANYTTDLAIARRERRRKMRIVEDDMKHDSQQRHAARRVR